MTALAAEITSRLALTDWDFTLSSVSSGLHGIHPYPAKFIPDIPRRLLELFPPEPGTAVLDPFCGSGTTLVEASRLGYKSVGIDLNPLACLIARVKTTRLPSNYEGPLRRVIADARSLVSSKTLEIPPIPRLDHWFLPDVQLALAALVEAFKKESSSELHNAFRVALSSIIVQVSNQESDTRYAAISKNVNQETVFEKFRRASRNTCEAVIAERSNMFTDLAPVDILNTDILAVAPPEVPEPIGLVITSPPYPNAYEYWLYHKYRMYWLGMDPIAVRKAEIGARPHYFKTHPQDEHDFEQQMQATFGLLHEITVPNAKVCFLVGRSIIHGRIIDNLALLQRAAGRQFACCGIASRVIRKTRKAFNLSHANIETEQLVVFSRL